MSVSAAAAAEDAVAAADNAAEAFRAWLGSAHWERRRLLMAASGVLEAHADRLSGLMTAEIGATAAWPRFNVSMASAMLVEAAAQVYNVKGETIPSDVPGATSMGLRVRAGVVLSIAPWNAPLVLAMRAVAFPVAYGNTVVLKASELSPATHLALGWVFAAAGFPPGVVNVISCDRAQARSVGDAFVERLCAQVAALRCGDPRDPQTQIGPLADPAAPARARALAVANDTAFGLSAGVLTSDHEKELAIPSSLRTGMAHVNDQPVNDEPHVPLRGVGDSGYERFGGTASIHEFTELRWTTVQRRTRKFHPLNRPPEQTGEDTT